MCKHCRRAADCVQCFTRCVASVLQGVVVLICVSHRPPRLARAATRPDLGAAESCPQDHPVWFECQPHPAHLQLLPDLVACIAVRHSSFDRQLCNIDGWLCLLHVVRYSSFRHRCSCLAWRRIGQQALPRHLQTYVDQSGCALPSRCQQA